MGEFGWWGGRKGRQRSERLGKLKWGSCSGEEGGGGKAAMMEEEEDTTGDGRMVEVE